MIYIKISSVIRTKITHIFSLSKKMSSFVSSENLPTYLLRELVKYVNTNGFPEIYNGGTTLFETIRNIITTLDKDPNRKSQNDVFNDLISVPISSDDLN